MLRSNISYAIFYNIKIKIDSYDDMPLKKKKLNMNNVVILIK